MERFNKSLARDAVSAYVGVAEKHGLTPTQLAIAWVKSRPFVTSTIIGATSMEQLKVRAPAVMPPAGSVVPILSMTVFGTALQAVNSG